MLQWLIATINWRLWSAINIYTLSHDNSSLCVCLTRTHVRRAPSLWTSIWKSMVIWKRSLNSFEILSILSVSFEEYLQNEKPTFYQEKFTLRPTFDVSDMQLMQTFWQHNRKSFRLFYWGTSSKYKSTLRFHYHSIILNLVLSLWT